MQLTQPSANTNATVAAAELARVQAAADTLQGRLGDLREKLAAAPDLATHKRLLSEIAEVEIERDFNDKLVLRAQEAAQDEARQAQSTRLRAHVDAASIATFRSVVGKHVQAFVAQVIATLSALAEIEAVAKRTNAERDTALVLSPRADVWPGDFLDRARAEILIALSKHPEVNVVGLRAAIEQPSADKAGLARRIFDLCGGGTPGYLEGVDLDGEIRLALDGAHSAAVRELAEKRAGVAEAARAKREQDERDAREKARRAEHEERTAAAARTGATVTRRSANGGN